MKGLTLHEPMASLIACGVKTIETRSWRGSQRYIGERIFIHAAKRKPTQDGLALLAGVDPLPEGYKRDAASDAIVPDTKVRIPLGKILAVATLSDFAQVEETNHIHQATGQPMVRAASSALMESVYFVSDKYGDFSVGRWLWVLTDVTLVKPSLIARGFQGFWECTLDSLEAYRKRSPISADRSPGNGLMDKIIETSNDPMWQVDQAEKAISAGNLEDASLMMYSAIEMAMTGLAQSRNLPHADHDDLLRLAITLDEEHGPEWSHFVRFEAARAMYDNFNLRFLDIEETLMSPENAREFVSCLQEYRAAA